MPISNARIRPWVRMTCLAALFAILDGSVLLPSRASVHAEDLARRPLEHKDYDVWNTMSNVQITRDGQWVTYSVRSGEIDSEAVLHIQHPETSRKYVIDRGTGARFTWDGKHVVFRVTPEKKKLKALRKKKTPSKDLPQPQLQILNLKTGAITTIDRIESFRLPEENGDWVAAILSPHDAVDSIEDKKADVNELYEVTASGLRRPEKKFNLKSREELAIERGNREREKPQPPESETQPETETKAETNTDFTKDNIKEKVPGKPLILMDLRSGITRTYPNVAGFTFSKDARRLAFSTSVKTDDTSDKTTVDNVQVIDLESMKSAMIADGTGEYKSMAFSEDATQLVLMTNKDDFASKTPAWSVYHWKAGSKAAKKIASEGDPGMTYGWWVAPNARPQFAEDGRRLYFDTAPVPDEVLEERKSESKADQASNQDGDTDDDDTKIKLDIWHWQDPQLQPQQLLQAQRERVRRYRAAYVMKSKKIVQLATRQVPNVEIDLRSPSAFAIANTNQKYRKTLSWDVPGFQDVWLVNLDTGDHSPLLEKVKWYASLSPEGRYIVWFDAEARQWYSKSTTDKDAEAIEISKGIEFPLQDELHDTPNLAPSYGTAGWLADDQAFLVYDRFDIWQLDPTGQAEPTCLTESLGRENQIRFRYRQLDPRARAIDRSQPMMLSAFDRKTKASGFYRLNPISEDANDNDAENNDANNDDAETVAEGSAALERLIMLDESVAGLRKAEASDQVLFTRSTFRRCPDLWASDTSFKKIRRISDINPQQDQYTWGDAELVRWKANDGQELEGILMKPDGFDASKKYPMMVYFYERNSDNLHQYYTPAAGRSIICHSFYVSRGYLVFIPDIPYQTGAPGPSAENAILPGVDALVERGFVQEDKIGMQGHSWGGYQTAYLVTRTDRFACAESGAPVSNMTSAYGGIRWGSGMSRMFQYERTQSRIGDDLWSAREKYVANSPVFFADKINTPLLILHNDEDGAVPWYQGIELFVALRRLEKPAWMLNYNGNPHWVMGDRNRRDFAIRMQQFFDHYLKDAPEPEWMAVGVPAVDKGENDGLELLEAESTAEQAQPTAEEVSQVASD
ncbi:MAG: prolyl oligopeptidase family serine peptidase [Planctomycetota bacterium]